MTKRKTREDLSAHISQKCVTKLPKRRNVQEARNAKRLIIELRSFTTPTNTRQSFVHPTLSAQVNVNMVIIAPSLTQSQRYRLNLLTNSVLTKTFTCFTSRLCGVPTTRTTISGTNACLPTTGKILGGNPSSISIRRINASTGVHVSSSITIRTAVQRSIDVFKVMAGKNKNTTRRTINLIPASTVSSATSLTVLTITMTQIWGNHYNSGLKCFLKHAP